MTISKSMALNEAVSSDADLVAACLGGDRNAFGWIVERYQRLLCSLAYSATGSVSESEDVAQETFLTAWRQLGDLRDAEKLRPWLCGILRHKVGRLRRGDAREPVRRADGLEAAGEIASTDDPARNLAMQKEEQAILWSELERVPALYREPLILYYRENRSVEHVAAALDLTEDAVKQRLARGRKILQERVLTFVEGALARSTPGRAFTLGVLASLPAMLPAPAKAAGIGAAAAAAQGSVLAKTTSIAALLASATGVATTLMGLRTSLDQSRTPRERRAVVIATIACFFGIVGYLFVLWLLRAGAFRWWEHRVVFAVICQVLAVGVITIWPFGFAWMLRSIRRLRSAERRRHPELFREARDQVGSSAGEYRSRATLFGVPLVHFRYSQADEGQRPVFGWVAGGDRAFGLLFAWGGWAVAPVSVGAFAAGVVSVGAVSVGVIGLGTFAAGALAVGCVAVGVKTFAWLSALGWETAQSGGFAIARIAAEGPVAIAQYANEPAALAILADPHAERNQMIFLIAIVLLSLVPTAYYASAVRRRMGRDRPAVKPDA